ncbi:hypothetical protein GBF38_022163 [Nibea albiflora]|uniref:Uncharacterized protein n=1 Tax=Nibea albiflora TaxID=240163 RepID=A0ACB7FI19_NIBAL|nr:hypothetical protein GBF38_022163 [Nibea albiflora]
MATMSRDWFNNLELRRVFTVPARNIPDLAPFYDDVMLILRDMADTVGAQVRRNDVIQLELIGENVQNHVSVAVEDAYGDAILPAFEGLLEQLVQSNAEIASDARPRVMSLSFRSEKNLQYVGAYPPLCDYGMERMSPAQQREFYDWYGEASQGVPYHHIAENFPLQQRDLWTNAADRHLAEPEPPVPAVPTCPYRPRFATQVVVKGHEPQPRPAANPDGWVTVVRGQKCSLPEDELAALDDQVVQKKVVLKVCFIPLTPVRFSPALLHAVEKTSPSFLPSPEVDTAVPVRIQVDTVVSDVEVFFVVTPSSGASMPVVDEDKATFHAVDLTSEPGFTVPVTGFIRIYTTDLPHELRPTPGEYDLARTTPEKAMTFYNTIALAIDREVEQQVDFLPLTKLKQGKDENPRELYERMLVMTKESCGLSRSMVNNLPPGYIQNIFVNSLQPKIKSKVLMTVGWPGKTLSELSEIAQHHSDYTEQKEYKMNETLMFAQVSRYTGGATRGRHNGRGNFKKQRWDQGRGSQNHSPILYKNQDKCYYCGDPNHWVRDCPYRESESRSILPTAPPLDSLTESQQTPRHNQ